MRWLGWSRLTDLAQLKPPAALLGSLFNLVVCVVVGIAVPPCHFHQIELALATGTIFHTRGITRRQVNGRRDL